jgi:XTP/dITP diphosphohydrolase
MPIVIAATRNQHKVQEMRAILGADFQVQDLNAFPAAPAVSEDAPTFEGNALKKSTALARWLAQTYPLIATDWPAAMVLADDSGLEVDALQGAPGVHSARYAALDDQGAMTGNSPDTANNAKLLRLLRDVPRDQRTGRFRCVLALAPVQARPGLAEPMIFEGACEGLIGFEPKGQGGFGYDPLFLPLGCSQTFAELGAEIKNQMSHRSRALAKLKKFLDGAHKIASSG